MTALIKTRFYTLAHPITGEIRYVGKTKNMLSSRKALHVYSARSSKFPNYNYNWLKSLDKQGLRPVIEEIETVFCSWEDAYIIEKYWIDQFLTWGFRLTNCGYGKGAGHINPAQERSKKACQIMVHKYDYNGTYVNSYISGREAAKHTGIGFKDISLVITGRRKTAGGFLWSTVKVDKLPKYIPLYSNSKTVYQYTLNLILINKFRSCKEASIKTGINQSSIIGVANKFKNKITAGGYKWSYTLLN